MPFDRGNNDHKIKRFFTSCFAMSTMVGRCQARQEMRSRFLILKTKTNGMYHLLIGCNIPYLDSNPISANLDIVPYGYTVSY